VAQTAGCSVPVGLEKCGAAMAALQSSGVVDMQDKFEMCAAMISGGH
jgi:hypothetical protein